MLAAYLSNGKKSCFCPLTSHSVQKKKWVPSVHETSVPWQTCIAMCIHYMCPLCSFFPAILLEILSRRPWAVRDVHTTDWGLLIQKGWELRGLDNVLALLACVEVTCFAFQLDFLAVGSSAGFRQFLYLLYINSKICNNINFLKSHPSVQHYTSGAAVTVSSGQKIKG